MVAPSPPPRSTTVAARTHRVAQTGPGLEEVAVRAHAEQIARTLGVVGAQVRPRGAQHEQTGGGFLDQPGRECRTHEDEQAFLGDIERSRHLTERAWAAGQFLDGPQFDQRHHGVDEHRMGHDPGQGTIGSFRDDGVRLLHAVPLGCHRATESDNARSERGK